MRILSRIRVNPDIVVDAIGAVALLLMIVAGIWIAYGLGLATGGAELLERV